MHSILLAGAQQIDFITLPESISSSNCLYHNIVFSQSPISSWRPPSLLVDKREREITDQISATFEF